MKISDSKTAMLLPALLIALGIFFSTSAHAQILLNGGFESPIIPSGTQVSGGGSVWTFTGGAFVNSNNFDNLGNTPYGNQYLELEPGASVSQTIAGFKNDSYFLGLDFADLNGVLSPSLTLLFNGNPVNTYFGAAQGGSPNPGLINFQSAVLSFGYAPGGTLTITIANTGSSEIAIDNIGLYDTSSTVPEPSAWLLMFSGLSFLAVWRWKRRCL